MRLAAFFALALTASAAAAQMPVCTPGLGCMPASAPVPGTLDPLFRAQQSRQRFEQQLDRQAESDRTVPAVTAPKAAAPLPNPCAAPVRLPGETPRPGAPQTPPECLVR